MPFRTAHGIIGELVANAARTGNTLASLPEVVIQAADKAIGPDVADHLGPANVVKHYKPEGAAGKKQLTRQISYWRRRLG